jgi:hypothetical protein
MIIVLVFQNCWCFVEGETGSCRQTCVMCGTEEVSIEDEEAIDIKDGIPEAISFPPIKTEEAIDIKDEIPEAISLPPIKTEQEVRLWGMCEVVAAHAFRPFIAPKRK